MPSANASANWHVRCVSVPGPDTDLTLHVVFDNARYIFGCGEGTQRTYVQKRLGTRGLEAIFLLNAENRTRMGLPGMIMTAADSGIPHLSIIGPPDTAHFISTFRSSVMREHFTLNSNSLPIGKTPDDVTEVFQTPNITVKAVALVPHPLRSQPLPDAPPIDLTTFRPDFSTTRPTTLDRRELEAWRDLIVQSMFKRSYQGSEQKEPKGPFIRGDGAFCANWPEARYPLPLPTSEEQATDMVYILEPPPVRGKFDVKRAAELGVPSGPARGRLVKGEDIEVDDPTAEGGKRIVRPSDCLVGGGPGAVLIIVTCSDINVPNLLSSTAFQAYSESGVHLVVHRVSSGVWRRSDYQAWMATFGAATQHWLAGTDQYSNDIVFRSSASKLADLAAIDKSVFRRPFDNNPGSFEVHPLPPQAIPLKPNYQVRMQPPAANELIPHHEKDSPVNPTPDGVFRLEDPVRLAVEQSRRVIQAIQPAEPFPGSSIRITTLGTGSACPSKYRNVSSTLLEIPRLKGDSDGSILLDCGEGTLGQLRRYYGPARMPQAYERLRMIFISHMHADHHLGLQRILEDRFQHGVTSTLYIVGPTNIALSLQESASWQQQASEAALNNVKFINSGVALRKKWNNGAGELPASPKRGLVATGAPVEWGQEDIFCGVRRWPEEDVLGMSDDLLFRQRQTLANMLNDLDLDAFQAPFVEHRGSANGLVLQHKSGWKIVYSGDTKPCASLVDAGFGATLLIHEATLEDDKPEMAASKGHSTFSQAIQVGKNMQARHILLNHFSQRYPKMPKMPLPTGDEAVSTGSSQDPLAPAPLARGSTSPRYKGRAQPSPVISISFDLMSVRIADMWKMAHYMEPISLLFPEEEEDGDNTEDAVKKDTNVVFPSTSEGHGRKKRASNSAHGLNHQAKKHRNAGIGKTSEERKLLKEMRIEMANGTARGEIEIGPDSPMNKRQARALAWRLNKAELPPSTVDLDLEFDTAGPETGRSTVGPVTEDVPLSSTMTASDNGNVLINADASAGVGYKWEPAEEVTSGTDFTGYFAATAVEQVDDSPMEGMPTDQDHLAGGDEPVIPPQSNEGTGSPPGR